MDEMLGDHRPGSQVTKPLVSRQAVHAATAGTEFAMFQYPAGEFDFEVEQ
ncbi:MAG: hypothetical protein ACRERU_09195 [Methylococcales bacterium]